eukprot:81917_1
MQNQLNLLLFVMTIPLITSSSLSWIAPTDAVLPYPLRAMVGGYFGKSIWLIHGWDLIEYNIEHNNYTIHPKLSGKSLSARSQIYTQIDESIYSFEYSWSINTLSIYNMKSKVFQQQDITSRDNSTIYWPCVTNIDFEFLLILGGWQTINHKSTDLNIFRILEISTFKWVEDGPPMLQPRSFHACNVHSNGYLYVIGGSDGLHFNSVINIDVSNIENIHNKQWNKLNDTLTYSATNLRSVVYETAIYVLGGQVSIWGYTDSVDIIDTITNTISFDSRMVRAVSEFPAIIAPEYNKLFVFGGEVGASSYTDAMQYATLVSLPTNEQTHSPTHLPTNFETNLPTLYPTDLPTNLPTFLPTHLPTNFPTNLPTLYPTDLPTNSPTFSPTNEPSNTVILNSISTQNVQATDSLLNADHHFRSNGVEWIYIGIGIATVVIIVMISTLVLIKFKRNKASSNKIELSILISSDTQNQEGQI